MYSSWSVKKHVFKSVEKDVRNLPILSRLFIRKCISITRCHDLIRKHRTTFVRHCKWMEYFRAKKIFWKETSEKNYFLHFPRFVHLRFLVQQARLLSFLQMPLRAPIDATALAFNSKKPSWAFASRLKDWRKEETRAIQFCSIVIGFLDCQLVSYFTAEFRASSWPLVVKTPTYSFAALCGP